LDGKDIQCATNYTLIFFLKWICADFLEKKLAIKFVGVKASMAPSAGGLNT
jgi:hypothetical protein